MSETSQSDVLEEIRGFREDLRGYRSEVRELVAQVTGLQSAIIEINARLPVVSLNDVDFRSSRESVISMTDEQRLLLHAGLREYGERRAYEVIAGRSRQARARFLDSKIGRFSAVAGAVAALGLLVTSVLSIVVALAR